MDPVSQGVVGAAAAQSVSIKSIRAAGIVGLLSGMAPDLDVLLQSADDPLLFLEYHRQFTHALVFIPFGGFICALLTYRLYARRYLSFAQTYSACTIGYATHGLLDACTSYGTQLLWPFSTTRIAWHNISIIDPLFTIPIVIGVIAAAIYNKRRVSIAVLIWACVYLAVGMIQRERAEIAVTALAERRGHVATRIEAKPSFANLLVWKVIYQAGEYYYVDALRLSTRVQHIPGVRVPVLNLQRDFPWLAGNSQQARDVELFRWFSAGYLAKSSSDSDTIIDMRYSILPHRADGLWGIRLKENAGPNAHVGYRVMRAVDPSIRQIFTDILLGRENVPPPSDGTKH